MNIFTRPPSLAWAPPPPWSTSKPMATMRRCSSVIWGRCREDNIREAGAADTEDSKEVTRLIMEAVRLLPPPDCRQHLDTELCDNETFGCSQWYHYSQTLVNFNNNQKLAHFVQLFYSNPHKPILSLSSPKSPCEIPVILFCYRQAKFTLSMSILPPKINLDAPRWDHIHSDMYFKQQRSSSKSPNALMSVCVKLEIKLVSCSSLNSPDNLTSNGQG